MATIIPCIEQHLYPYISIAKILHEKHKGKLQKLLSLRLLALNLFCLHWSGAFKSSGYTELKLCCGNCPTNACMHLYDRVLKHLCCLTSTFSCSIYYFEVRLALPTFLFSFYLLVSYWKWFYWLPAPCAPC